MHEDWLQVRVSHRNPTEDFFLSILSSTSTKREAKSYLQRFTPQSKGSIPPDARNHILTSPDANKAYYDPIQSSNPGVNLGSLYLPTTSINQSPVFFQGSNFRQPLKSSSDGLHVAVVKIRSPQTIEDSVLDGIGRTLSQLGRLGLTSVVVVDVDETQPPDQNILSSRSFALSQADRVTTAIDQHGRPGARRLDNILSVSETTGQTKSALRVQGQVRVLFRNLLLAPLLRGLIPVIASLAYSPGDQKVVSITADDVVLALTREFAGLIQAPPLDEDPMKASDRALSLQRQVTLDRIIVIDPLGGIPASSGPYPAHVFINLEQEASTIHDDLYRTLSPLTNSEVPASDVAKIIHLKNLKLVRDNLALLPPSSSALLTTPAEASNSGHARLTSASNFGVGTRRQKNPLIHNLLTDKPSFSSSLPSGRLKSSNAEQSMPSASRSPATPNTTFVKRGMPLTILPDPRIQTWTAAAAIGKSKLTLDDPRIDLPRLIDLIEDSFDRKLDVEHYLSRVNNRIAGIIIAGEYEGGALLTWEQPPGTSDEERMVPYLDKFAVRKRSQGAGGVADIIFKSMVRDCFPDGVCWRSRKNNPVNKWYFERARGTWKLPKTNWTMFWTTEKASKDQQTFLDYEAVCRAVVPSWADNKDVVD